MAESGWLHVSCMAPTAFNNAAPITRPQDARKHYFGVPFNAGTASILHALLYKRGTPPAGNILFEIWQAKSGGNWFTDVVSGSNWDILGVGSLDPASVTGANSWQNATWVPIPLASPVYLDSMPQGVFPTDEQESISRYALKIVQISASSNADAANAVNFPFSNSHNYAFGISARSTEAIGDSTSFKYEDLPFAISGLVTPSSKWYDRPISGIFDVGSTSPGKTDMVSSTFNRVAAKFTAVGSRVTRATMGLQYDGAVNIKTFAGLWTSNATSDQPATCVATSQLIIINSVAGGESTLFNGDVATLNLAPHFVFSAAPVTSGDTYWLAVEVLSYAYASGASYVAPRRTSQPRKYCYWDQRSSAVIFNSDSQSPQIQAWYVDSETLATGSIDHGGVPASTLGPGYRRNYPNIYQRRYAELTQRKEPL